MDTIVIPILHERKLRHLEEKSHSYKVVLSGLEPGSLALEPGSWINTPPWSRHSLHGNVIVVACCHAFFWAASPGFPWWFPLLSPRHWGCSDGARRSMRGNTRKNLERHHSYRRWVGPGHGCWQTLAQRDPSLKSLAFQRGPVPHPACLCLNLLNAPCISLWPAPSTHSVFVHQQTSPTTSLEHS